MAIQILADIAAMTMRMLILNTLFPGSSSTVPKNPINMSAANMDFGISQFQVGHLAGGGRDGGIMSSRGRSRPSRAACLLVFRPSWACDFDGSRLVRSWIP